LYRISGNIAPMSTVNFSATILAPTSGATEATPPCQVIQQQDTTDTVNCSDDNELLNVMLRLLGFDIPVPTESEEYSTSVLVKPLNTYTNLNISLTKGTLSDPIIESGDSTKIVTIALSDFVATENGGYVDLTSKMDLTESDDITSARWVSNPTDSQMVSINPKPSVSVDKNNRFSLDQAMGGRLLVNVWSIAERYKINITLGDGEVEGAYQSSLIVTAEGCEGRPTRFEIDVPECKQNALYNKYGWPGDGEGGDTIIKEKIPEVEGADAEQRYCLCDNHPFVGATPSSAAPADPDNACLGGSCDQINPTCVPDDGGNHDHCG